jgi:hypothetical protein
MLGRSLLSLLAVAAVVVQSSAAAVFGGIYMISWEGKFFLTAYGKSIGSLAVLQYLGEAPPGYQEWEVKENFDTDTVEIRNVGTGLYLSPSNPEAPNHRELVVQSNEPFVWRRLPGETGSTYFLQDSTSSFVISQSRLQIFPTRLDLQEFVPTKKEQQFTFGPVNSIDRETRTHRTCGPWRMSRESFQ